MCPAEDTTSSQVAPPEEELARLKTEHASLESRLDELEGLRFPTGSEESEIKQLKRDKLSLKERIEKLQV